MASPVLSRAVASLLAAALATCSAPAPGAPRSAAGGADPAPPETQRRAPSAAGQWPDDPPTGFMKKVALESMTKHPRAFYHLGVPDDYTPEKAWPLMVLLHGGPHAGADNLVPFFRRGLTAKGVINVYPQCLTPQLLAWNYPHEMAYVLRIIRQVGRTYRVDDRRIYLVGHSMGGGGAWCQGAVLRDVWAGIAPLSAWYGASPRPKAEWYKGLPIYIIHGEKDRHVPVQNAHLAMRDLKRIGHAEHVYVELEGVGHGFFHPWKEVGAPEIGKLVAWLLAHRRPRPANLAAAAESLAAWGKPFGWSPTGSPVGGYEQDESP